MKWTPEEDSIIVECVKAGLSASQSARELRAKGFDRITSQFIGRYTRLREKGLCPKLARNPNGQTIPSPWDRSALRHEVVIELAKTFPSATIMELAEAVASDTGTVGLHLIRCKIAREEGSKKDYCCQRVAEMRASLMREAA